MLVIRSTLDAFCYDEPIIRQQQSTIQQR